MQKTYYERVLSSDSLPLAQILDEEVARLRTRGPLSTNPEQTDFGDGLARYLTHALEAFKRGVAQRMSPDEFAGFQAQPGFQEILLQTAAREYWTYESFFYLRAFGEHTVRIGAETTGELLRTPLQGTGSALQMDPPAVMLVFEAPEMVDSLYLGERRKAEGRLRGDVPVHVFAIQTPVSEGFAARRLKLLSVHSDQAESYRIEVRRLLLRDEMALEDILATDLGEQGRSPLESRHLDPLAGGLAPGARRREDTGFVGQRLPYYRVVVGALLRLFRDAAGVPCTVSPADSGLDWRELLPAGR
jgi:hypothetical protein